MSNEYFTESGTPSTSAALASSAIRSEFALVGDGFDKLPTLAANGSKLVAVNSGATGLEAVTAATARTAVGMATSSTDNAIVRFDGATGATQNSVITVGDTGNVLGMGTLGCGAITTTGAFSGTSGTFSTTLSVTGASTLAAVSATTGAFSGDFAVNTNKFTVASATGNVVIAGTASIAGSLSVTAAAYTPSRTPSHSATPTFDAATGNVFEPGALTANVTSMTISNAVAGQTINIRFVQDGTGGRTVTVPSGAKISGSLNTAASSVTWLTMTYSSLATRWEGGWMQVPA